MRALNGYPVWLMLGGAVVVLLYSAWQCLKLYDDYEFNAAMCTGDLYTASRHRSDYGRFARAQQLRMDGDYPQAQQVFTAIDTARYPLLQRPVLFELSHSYIEQAVAFEKRNDNEQRIPLLELAKENYREILTRHPQDWSVRNNLARVLRMLPDASLTRDEDEDVMPERSPQAPVQTIGHDRLP